MKVKHYFILVGLSVIAFIALMNYKPTPPAIGTTRLIDGFGEPTITITKKRSPTIDISYGKFLVEPVGDNVPFIIHYNGGKGGGGWDHKIPARKDFEELNFQPEFFPEKLVTVSFSLQPDAEIEKAEIKYSIKKL